MTSQKLRREYLCSFNKPGITISASRLHICWWGQPFLPITITWRWWILWPLRFFSVVSSLPLGPRLTPSNFFSSPFIRPSLLLHVTMCSNCFVPKKKYYLFWFLDQSIRKFTTFLAWLLTVTFENVREALSSTRRDYIINICSEI